jgi:hypothetical protein
MDTPATAAVPAPDPAVAPAAPAAASGAVAGIGIGHMPLWLRLTLMTAAVVVLWLVTFDNGQASAMVDSTGTALHELFHDARHLSGAPCH